MNGALLGFLTTTFAYFLYYAFIGDVDKLLRQAILICVAVAIGLFWQVYKLRKERL